MPTIESILPLYNQKYGTSLHYEDLIQYDISSFIDTRCVNLFEEFLTNELVKSLIIDDEALSVIDELSRKHDLYYATARHPYIMKSTDDWLGSRIRNYQSKNLIRCRDKTMLSFDVMIDDNIENLIEGKFFGILPTRPWNSDYSVKPYRIKRIFHLSEVPKIIHDFEKSC